MKKRFAYLISFFVALVLIFLVQKPFFMLYNSAASSDVSWTDYFKVMYHGLSLDAATAGYLVALPFLAVLVSVWFKRFPLRAVLVGYYALISLLMAIIFVVDMGLYPFWKFKLDASIFLYMDSPKNALASVSVGFVLLRVLVMILLAGLTAWGLYKLTPSHLPATTKKLSGTAGLLVLGGLLFIVIRGGVTESTSNIGQVYFCNNEFLNHSAVNPAFSLLSSVSKTQNYEEQFNFFSEEERAHLFDGLYPVRGKNTVELLNTKRPNILIILMEGFGLPADDSASCGSNRLPRNPAMISASAVVPTSVRKLTPAIARIQSQRPRARRSSVLFMKSMFCFPSTFSYFLSICGAKSGAGIVPAPLLPQRIYLLVYPFSPDAAISNALC